MGNMILYTKKGFSLLAVMTFMLSSAMLGSGMMYMANQQSETTADYYSKMTAEDAASSAMSWFEGYIEDYVSVSANKTKFIAWLQDFNDSSDAKWYNGSSEVVQAFIINSIDDASGVSVDGKNIKAKVKIEKYDSENSIMTLKFVGFGANDSKKTKYGVFKLEGVNTYIVTTPSFNGAYLRYGLYAGAGGYLADAVDIDNTGAYFGDLEIELPIQYNAITDATRLCQTVSIEGDLKVMNTDANVFLVNDTYDLQGNVYINGGVNFNSLGDFGTLGEDNTMFFNGPADFDQPVNFLNKTYLMGFSDNIAQSITFQDEAYIKTGANANNKGVLVATRFKSTPTFNSDAQVYTDVYIDGVPVDGTFFNAAAINVASGHTVTSTGVDYGVSVSGGGDLVYGNVDAKTKENVLTPAEYAAYEEVDIDYDDIRSMTSGTGLYAGAQRGFALSDLDALGITWDYNSDGKLDASDVNMIYKSGDIALTDNGVLPIVVDDVDKMNLAGDEKLGAGVHVLLLIDDADKVYGKDETWSMWETETAGSSDKCDRINSASLGFIVSENGSVDYTNMNIDNYRGMIHDEYHDIMQLGGSMNIQGAIIGKHVVATKNPFYLDYDNEAISMYYDMGILLDPVTHDKYVPEDNGSIPSGETVPDSSVVESRSAIIPVKIFEY